ncbi:MAG: DUF2183 domain-containing protein [Bacteroidetes bacterium]|nr:DUF2183 domain-containing protein [Bacteroidota bacterium]
MIDWNKPFFRFIRRLNELYDRITYKITPRRFWGKRHRLEIKLFSGFGHSKAIRISGRVLLFKKPPGKEKLSAWRQFRATLSLFNSSEIIGAKVRIHIGEYSYDLTSDREGYIYLSVDWKHEVFPKNLEKVQIKAELLDSPYGNFDGVTTSANCFLVTEQAKLGLITDIDDTVLKTDVTSRFKWRAVYATFFEDLTERKAIPYSTDFVKMLRKDGPVFYVSNSPWNIYPFLKAFLERNQFPGGPVLLRDIGIPHDLSDPRPHKVKTISQILDLYPDLTFVLMGDSGEKDADYYRQIEEKYPGRIFVRLIRKVPGTVIRSNTDQTHYFEEYDELAEWWKTFGESRKS